MPAWLDRVLLDHALFDLGDPGERARLAEAIIEAVPLDEVRAAIASSATTVVRQKLDADLAPSLVAACTEIGNNAAQTVIFALAGLTEARCSCGWVGTSESVDDHLCALDSPMDTEARR